MTSGTCTYRVLGGPMYAAVTFVIVALLSLQLTRIATGVLIATGVPPTSTAFQARSAFSGAGFTTTESENVVNHPVRRQFKVLGVRTMTPVPRSHGRRAAI